MRYFYRLSNKFHCPVVNLERLWSLYPHEVREKAAGRGATPVVDVTHHKGAFQKRGYDEGGLVIENGLELQRPSIPNINNLSTHSTKSATSISFHLSR
ncbi:hypothetical protein RJ639_024747 [Escallonia herrerae]|uniref:Uncharacterized protein n=1 Tax=Escallonia herrerae TaxID=1293975 RepID=A0AA88S3J0_9ASTE|nr:hypothetical protein RJ639_024747 [Escallonia herrerae]